MIVLPCTRKFENRGYVKVNGQCQKKKKEKKKGVVII